MEQVHQSHTHKNNDVAHPAETPIDKMEMYMRRSSEDLAAIRQSLCEPTIKQVGVQVGVTLVSAAALTLGWVGVNALVGWLIGPSKPEVVAVPKIATK